MSIRPFHRVTATAVLALALTTAACGGGGNDTASSSATTTNAAGAAASSSSSSTAKVDANTATVAEMTAAFQAADISNAARWAKEVEEYRPYPTDDPTFAKLKQNLAKYNPGDDVVNGIISTLSL